MKYTVKLKKKKKKQQPICSGFNMLTHEQLETYTGTYVPSTVATNAPVFHDSWTSPMLTKFIGPVSWVSYENITF